jgi:hypothetical protein
MTALEKILSPLPAPGSLLPYLLLAGHFALFSVPAQAETSAATAASCPYLAQSSDKDTSSTKSVYDSQSKALNIQVERSVPEMFWGIAESRTRDRATKILDNCPNVKAVHVTFQSGQRLTVTRAASR